MGVIERYLYNPQICFKEPPTNTKESKDLAAPLLDCSNKKITLHNNLVEESTTPIRDIKGIRILASQISLINPINFLLQAVHPGILDDSIHIEFVTGKTAKVLNFFHKKMLFVCYYCYDLHKACDNLDKYERHVVNEHRPGTVGYPGFPDIEKFEVERSRTKQGRNNAYTRIQ